MTKRLSDEEIARLDNPGALNVLEELIRRKQVRLNAATPHAEVELSATGIELGALVANYRALLDEVVALRAEVETGRRCPASLGLLLPADQRDCLLPRGHEGDHKAVMHAWARRNPGAGPSPLPAVVDKAIEARERVFVLE